MIGFRGGRGVGVVTLLLSAACSDGRDRPSGGGIFGPEGEPPTATAAVRITNPEDGFVVAAASITDPNGVTITIVGDLDQGRTLDVDGRFSAYGPLPFFTSSLSPPPGTIALSVRVSGNRFHFPGPGTAVVRARLTDGEGRIMGADSVLIDVR